MKAKESIRNRYIRKIVFQWAGMENVEIDENGDPVFLKTFNTMMEEVKKVCDYRFRFGTNQKISLVAQALAYGDRRMFPVVEALAEDKRVKYYGGMGAGSEILEVFAEHMRNLTSLNWDYFVRERDEDEIFPWDMLSTGMDKSWLLGQFRKAKEAAKTPIDQEGCLRKPCYEKCTVCGICVSKERSKDDFWPENIYGKGRSLPKFEYQDHSADQVDMLQVLDEYIKPQKLRVLRLEVDINPYYRYVDSEKLKYRIRRACNRAGIPVRTDVAAASSKILEKAWYSGKELYELYLADKRFSMSEQEVVEAINQNFADDAMLVTRAEWYSGEAATLGKNFEFVLYSITINNEDYSYSAVRDEVQLLNSSKDYPIKLKVKSKTKRDAFETVNVNAWEYLYKCFIKDNEDGTWTLFAALSENMDMYSFITPILKTSKRNLYKYPVIIEEFLLRNTEGASLDMFATGCEVCGEEIEDTIWGEPVSEQYCLEHKYLEGFKRRAIEVQVGQSEDMDDQEEEKFELGGHDDDDEDTDLEDEILSKTGNTGV